MTGDLLLRDETAADAATVDALIADAFLGNPHSQGQEPALMRALRAAGATTVNLVAELGGTIVGQVAVSPVTIDSAASAWHGLGPVAVRPDRQRRGIGGRLIEEALARLWERNSDGCLLVGEPAFYGRFGFHQTTRLVLPGVPSANFLILPMAGDEPAGTVAFHPAFTAGLDA